MLDKLNKIMTSKWTGRVAAGLLVIGTGLALMNLTGCALADRAAGVGSGPADQGGNAGVIGAVGALGQSLPGWLGWAFSLVGAAGTAYKTYRERKLGISNVNYDEALRSIVEAIDQAFKAGTLSAVTKDELYAALAEKKNEIMSDPEFLTKFVALIKSNIR